METPGQISTEIDIFANSGPAGTGMPVKGCEAKIVDESVNEVARE
jgi:hypothetical protein